MSTNLNELERRLWDAADELRANFKLRSSEYFIPVLDLIFLRYADHKFTQADGEFSNETASSERIKHDLAVDTLKWATHTH